MPAVVIVALSVSERIKDLGAYAGFASVLGLAVLSLLYFGQARELKRLREWAGRAPERTAELQEQAVAAATTGVGGPASVRRVAAQPAPAATRAGGAVLPAAPVTAAATAAARPGAPGALELKTPPATAAAAAAAATPPASATPSAQPAVAGATPPATATPAGQSPATATPAGQPPAAGTPASGAGQETQAMDAVEAPQPAAAGAGPGASDDDTHSAPIPLRKASEVRAAPAAAPSVRTRMAAGGESWPPEDEERPKRGVLPYAAGGVAALLVVVVLATQLFGGDDGPATQQTSVPAQTQTEPEPNAIEDPSTTSTSTTAAPPLNRSEFSVFVLNGTATNGLGASVNKKLETLGYRPAGSPQTATDQTETTTRVAYAEGKKRAANDVAKQLQVPAANVVPADAGTSAQGAGADVIVTIGADKAAQ